MTRYQKRMIDWAYWGGNKTEWKMLLWFMGGGFALGFAAQTGVALFNAGRLLWRMVCRRWWHISHAEYKGFTGFKVSKGSILLSIAADVHIPPIEVHTEVNTTVNDMYHEGYNAGFRVGWAESELKYRSDETWALALCAAEDRGFVTAYLRFGDVVRNLADRLVPLEQFGIDLSVLRDLQENH